MELEDFMCHNSSELMLSQFVVIYLLQNRSFGYTIHTYKYENTLCIMNRSKI